MAKHGLIAPGAARSLSGFTWIVFALIWSAGPYVLVSRSARAQSHNAPNVSAPGVPVSVEVVVQDRDGSPVRGLGRDSFSLFEDGAGRQITTCEEVRDDPSETVPGARRGKTVLILFDGRNISPGRFAPARESAEKFVQAHMRPQDLFAAAYYNNSLEMVQEFTGEPGKILHAIRQLGGSSGNPGAWSQTANQRYASGAENLRFSESLVALNSELALMRGRKAIIFYSQGSPSNRIDSSQAVRDSALRAKVAYYTIDSRALDTAGRAGRAEVQSTPNAERQIAGLNGRVSVNYPPMLDYSMRDLGGKTGGAALFNSGDFTGWLDTVDHELSNYYVLGFQSSKQPETRPRRIEVKTERAGVTIKVREVESGR